MKNTNSLATTSATYTPAGSGPLTATSTEDAKKFKTTTKVDIGTGSAMKVTDPNGKITESEFDSLGRLTKL